VDATYHDTVKAQIGGNALLDYEYKDDILKIIDKFSESELQQMAKSDKNRFFYQNGQSGIESKLKTEMPDRIKKTLQAQANRAARNGQQASNKFVANNFDTTYTRGGHKYVSGKRIY